MAAAGQMMIVVAALILMAGSTTAVTTYTVGDSLGWAIPPNTTFYSSWAASKTFQIGDSVVFNWASGHTVGEVLTKADYDSCTSPGTVNATSPVTVTLVSNTTRYFFCTIDTHCSLGQKVTITVGSSTGSVSNPPPPPPPQSVSPNSNTSSPPPPPPPPSSASSLTLSGAAVVSFMVFSFFMSM